LSDNLLARFVTEGSGWIVDADVRGYCDSRDRTQWRALLRPRVNDGSILRLIGNWLRAGVRDGGVLQHPDTGVVQGGVSSPVLANMMLHHVLDAWCAQEVQPRLKGRSFLTRFADDCVIGCEREADARRVMAVLPKRFARFGLRIHPEKTALMAFSNPRARRGSTEGHGTCDCLGLTHYWAQSRRGYGVSKRQTARKRLRRTTKALWRWCRINRHLPLQDQDAMLCQK
jgi:hypothetical protein